MISYAFDHPNSWAGVVGAATSALPPTFAPWSDDGTGAVPTIRCWFGDEPLAGLPSPSADRTVTSMVIGRRPMTSARLTSWLWRTVTSVVSDDDRDQIASWNIGESTAAFPLPGGPAAARVARATIREVVGPAERVEDMMIVGSELAANAVLHGHGEVQMQLHQAPSAVAIELRDHNALRAPAVRRTPVLSVTGRGMSIVDSLAAHWGVTVRTDSKSVWCEIPR